MSELFRLVETVRMPVAAGGEDALLAFLDGHAYFAQAELAASRVLVQEGGQEVVLIIDWVDDQAPERALTSPAGEALLDGLKSLLSGAPEVTYYRARGSR
ncbi:hypothetical protein DPM19_01015 [Actinomadura craniellae]|uniref:ABM domain-containing protein n=1 Tax=Actinomadura craniellae TaxID=2231787 RepID=A0A365HCB9_9ACTN|nr:hypothetical protein [Actinomadura craniellae]RAY16780.1 hypothetical protein DPM19_01015 [Actinomadura craniellae]